MTKLETQALDAAAEAADDARNRAKRKKWLLILGSTVLSNAIGYGLYSHYYGSKFISTDNAYTAAENAQVTPAISGIVREVRVNDTQQVQKGDVIVVLDDTDARLAVAQAEAELGRALRRVRGVGASLRLSRRVAETLGGDAGRAGRCRHLSLPAAVGPWHARSGQRDGEAQEVHAGGRRREDHLSPADLLGRGRQAHGPRGRGQALLIRRIEGQDTQDFHARDRRLRALSGRQSPGRNRLHLRLALRADAIAAAICSARSQNCGNSS